MSRASPVVVGSLLSALAIACGGSTEIAGAGGTGGAGGAGAAGAGGTSPHCEGIFQLCCDAQGNKVAQVCAADGLGCPAGTTLVPGATPGTSCPKPGECTLLESCSATEYCDYPDDRCGSGVVGTCKPRPPACDLLLAPVCSCAGKVEGNACTAYANGADLDAAGNCPPQLGSFSCGAKFCSQAAQYCEVQMNDVMGQADSYSCKALPASCGTTPSCGCVASEPCGSYCTADAAGNLRLSCPGG